MSSASSFVFPQSLELARLPTPLQPLRRLSRHLRTELLCKRDDLTGCALSGNKVRKLEFLMADAIDRDHIGVITCGGEQSNHARATAVAAARMGLECHLLLRTADRRKRPRKRGNILLDLLVGATIDWISPEVYEDRETLLEEQAIKRGKAARGKYYVIPEGGSNELGAWGYVRCIEELAEDLGPVPATIVYPVGSGGTAAGLIAGCRLYDLPYRLIGVCVADDRPTFQHRIADILEAMSRRYDVDVATNPEDIELWDDYVGRGYALSREAELQCIVDVGREEGLLLDPVYTGKAMYGLLTELAKKRRLRSPIVFLHTGGIFGLFPHYGQLAPLLEHRSA